MLFLKVITLATILSPPLLLNVESRRCQTRKPCNTEKCRGVVHCTYRQYWAEYNKYCKKCEYPPPSTVRCPKKLKVSPPKACPLFVYNKCTPEMYTKELCKPCQHCPRSPQSETQPADPCARIRCREGFRCVNTQNCVGQNCELVGNCVADTNQPVVRGVCPLPGISTCEFSDCSTDGCAQGLLCCPKGCGGTSCQKPV